MAGLTWLEVAVAAPIATTLTYRHPPSSTVAPRPGLRLLAPLGGRQVTGYLLACLDSPPEPGGYAIRDLIRYLDPEPLFPAEMVDFFRWLADYYQHPIGEVIKAALPAGLAPQSGRLITLTDHGREMLARLSAPERPAGKWFARLLKDGRLTVAATRKLGRDGQGGLLARWEQQGLIVASETAAQDAVGEKTELCLAWPLGPGLPAGTRLLSSERRLLALLDELGRAGGQPWLPVRQLVPRYRGYRKPMCSLAERGLLQLAERPVYRDPFGEPPPVSSPPVRLTDEQETAMQSLAPALAARRYAPFLLHGVTGSGKTEVYLQASALTLAQGQGVLVLVPEIALANQIEGDFLSRFGNQVAILHSGLNAGERFDQWRRILSGQAQVVIGARSALFAPLTGLGLIIVDEEHDGAYKQEDGFRYQARDAAVMRAKQTGCVVLLGSATPAITSFYHGATGKYRRLTLTRRVAERRLPAVEIVDLRAVPTVSGRPPLFSPQLLGQIRETLAQGNQSLIFLNRRGFANLVLCQDCGQVLRCGHCQVSLTLHQQSGQLVCHYCGFAIKNAALCPQCRSAHLVPVGFGTERIEEELTRLLPGARIGRLDRDTATARGQQLAILKAMRQRQIDILVGTQMIAKGHHFPHVTLVGVVWADAGLGLPDYKAGERTFQLLTQVFGRAGRGESPGRVVVQTLNPEHYSIVTSQGHDYHTLYAEELGRRRLLGFPPYCRLVNIRLEGRQAKEVERAAIRLGRLARDEAQALGIGVLGPAPAPIAKLRDLYRWQLLLKGVNLKTLHDLSVRLAGVKPAALGASAVKLQVDVDPESMV